jgi:integrase/recombinase XerD
VVVDLRSRGWKPVTVNGAIRSWNAFLKWSGSVVKIAKLKEEQRALPTFALDDIKKFQLWRPKTWTDKRLQVLVLLLCDSAARITEVLQLKWSDVNFDDCLILLHGKGQKDRRIPMSYELRKVLFKWRRENKHEYVLSTRERSGMLNRFNCLRDVRALCLTLDVKPPARLLHAFRHTWALNAIRRGASAFHVQKQLGHTDLEMTRRYCNLSVADLQGIHQQTSLLSA